MSAEHQYRWMRAEGLDQYKVLLRTWEVLKKLWWCFYILSCAVTELISFPDSSTK